MAVAVAATVVAVGSWRLPHRLQVSTDIVGFPTFYDYTNRPTVYLYYLVVLGFPAIALLLYLLLARIATRTGLLVRSRNRPAGAVPRDPDGEPSTWTDRVAALARVAGLGSLLGLETAVARGSVHAAFWVTLVVVASAYVLAVVAGSWLINTRFAREGVLSTTVSGINALAAPLTIGGLLWISSQTTLTVTSPPSTHHYPWFHTWLAVPLMTAAVIAIGIQIVRSRSGRAIQVLERKALTVIAGSVVIFLFQSRLPGALGAMDMFHEGEFLVPARLTSAGAFPWRDILTIHGLFQDTLSPMLGQHLLDPSRWGAAAGWQLVLYPLAYVSLYLFGARFFWRNWLFLLAFGVLLAGWYLVPAFTRFLLWPLILILLSYVLVHPRWWLGVSLGAILVAQTAVQPESAYCIPACALAVLLRDLIAFRHERALWPAMARTTWLAAGGSAVLVALAAVLASQHALQSFIFYFVIFAPDHWLTGAFVVPWMALDGPNVLMMVTPLVALLASSLYFAVHIVRRAPLDMHGWVMIAAATFALLYYPKFLDRADSSHVTEAYWVALPLVALVLFKICSRLDTLLARVRPIAQMGRRLTLRPAALVLLLATLLLVPASLVNRAEVMAKQFRPSATAEPWLAQLGYSQGAMDQATYDDLRSVLQSYLGPNDWIFDFSNAPGLYYYLLHYTPHTRYYNVSMAIPEAAQQDLIAELRRDPPKLVVQSNDRYGAGNWDLIPDMVRHYDVSQYILDHYRPLLSVRGQVIYARVGADVPAPGTLDPHLQDQIVTSDLPFRDGACRWGYAPNFLSTSPGEATAITAATVAVPPDDAVIQGWVSDATYYDYVRQVALVIDGRVASMTHVLPPRPDRASPGATAKSFEIAVARSELTNAHSIEVTSVSASGNASVIPFSKTAQQLPGTRDRSANGSEAVLPGAGRLHIRGATAGTVESITVNPHAVQVAPPPGKSWSDYRWIEIDSRSGFHPDTFQLSDRLFGDSGREISFQTTATSPRSYRVQVGSCAQWHAYGAAPLFLTYENAQDIASIKFVS